MPEAKVKTMMSVFCFLMCVVIMLMFMYPEELIRLLEMQLHLLMDLMNDSLLDRNGIVAVLNNEFIFN